MLVKLLYSSHSGDKIVRSVCVSGLYRFQEKRKQLGSSVKRLCPSHLGLYLSVSLIPVSDSELEASLQALSASSCWHQHVLQHASREQGARQGAGLWTLLLSLPALEHYKPILPFETTCLLLSRNLPCLFVGLLSFLQLCGANKACHPPRIKMYILYCTSYTVTFFF